MAETVGKPQDQPNTPNQPVKSIFHWSRIAGTLNLPWLTRNGSTDENKESPKAVSVIDIKENKSDTGVKENSSVRKSKKSVSGSVKSKAPESNSSDGSSYTSSDSSSESSTTHTPTPCTPSPTAWPRGPFSEESVRSTSSDDSDSLYDRRTQNIDLLTYEPGDTFKRSITCNEDFFKSTRVTDEITYPDIFFSVSHYQSMIKSALSCFFSSGEYEGLTFRDLLDYNKLSYWQFLICQKGKHPIVDLLCVFFVPHLAVYWRRKLRFINILLSLGDTACADHQYYSIKNLINGVKYPIAPVTRDDNHQHITGGKKRIVIEKSSPSLLYLQSRQRNHNFPHMAPRYVFSHNNDLRCRN